MMNQGKAGVLVIALVFLTGMIFVTAMGDDGNEPSLVEIALARELDTVTQTPEDAPAPPDPTGDGTLDDDGTAFGNNGGPNSDDGDRTAGNDGTRDGDATSGDDGTILGDNGGANSVDGDATAMRDRLRDERARVEGLRARVAALQAQLRRERVASRRQLASARPGSPAPSRSVPRRSWGDSDSGGGDT